SSGRSTGTGIDDHDHQTGCARRARFPHGARSGTTAQCESAAVGSEQARSGEVRDHRGVFDGQLGAIRLALRLDHPPGTVHQTTANVDAQNLARTFYRGKSTFLLEERHDPSGWKTILWIEPERDFLVSRYVLYFEQQNIADIDIDYVQDQRWGWIPNGWRVTEMLANGS